MTKSRFLIAAAMMLAGGLGGCGRPAPKPEDQTPARAVRLALVEQRTLHGGISAAGQLVSREEVAINSELSGYRVATVFVEAGAQVKAGQPLAQLDDTLLRAQIAQQTALAAQQRSAADQAEVQLKNVAGLEGKGVLSAEQLDARRFQARSTRAALDAQLAALRDMLTRQDRLTIRAPVDGLILERNVRPGDVAAGGASSTPMFRMAREGLVELAAQIPQANLGAVHVGDAAQVDLPGGASVAGTVRLVSPSIDAQTQLGIVRVSLPKSAEAYAGGFGQATFIDGGRRALTVPESAIRYDADGVSLMVVGADNRVSQVSVKTGLHAGGYVELLRGPPAGTRVLLSSAVFMLPGDLVKPVDAAPSAAAAR